MIHPWHDLPAGRHPPDQVTAIIEIPAGLRLRPPHPLPHQIYKDLEGKRVNLVGWDKGEVAMQEVMKSVGRYEEKYGNGRKL